MNRIVPSILGLAMAGALAGCSEPLQQDTVLSYREGALDYANVAAEPMALNGSLFASDIELLSNEAVHEILDTPVPMRSDAKIALLNLTPGGLSLRVSRSHWHTEEYMDLQRRYVQTLIDDLTKLPTVREVVSIPSIMISDTMTLPLMREAAVRMQADLLLIYGIRSELFQRNRFLEKDQIKAFATCELLLFDTRTGVIPFTTVATETFRTSPDPNDFGRAETQQRARSEATFLALDKAGKAAGRFLAETEAK